MTKRSADAELDRLATDSVCDVVCLRCGCLCDDLVVEKSDGRVVGVQNVCEKARDWFLEGPPPEDEAVAAMVEGRAVDVEEALDAAASLLRRSCRPLLDGFVHLTCEGQGLAVDLAERTGAILVGSASREHGGMSDAEVAVGAVTATLGEIRNRADVVVAWGCDPATSHPRFLDRYALHASGRFVPGGRRDRTLIVLGDPSWPTSEQADYVISMQAGADFAVAWVLRAILCGIELESDVVASVTGAALDTWVELTTTLRRARYGAILFDGSACGKEVEPVTRSVLQLIGALNEETPFAYVPLGAGSNADGAAQVLGWKTGMGGCLDFCSGRPERRWDVRSAKAVLSRREVDSAVLFHCDPLGELEPGEWQWLGHVPTVVVSGGVNATSESATVSIRTAPVGRSARGTVFRSDGVALPLRPFLDSRNPSDEQILIGLLDRLRSP